MNLPRLALVAAALALSHTASAAASDAPVMLIHSAPGFTTVRAVALGARVVSAAGLITAGQLAGVRLLVVVGPQTPFRDEEQAAIHDFVAHGGALLLAVDDTGRQPKAREIANPLLSPYGMEFTADVPYIHNVGAVAGPNAINRARRELPYSGGRAVRGGTRFSTILDTDQLAHGAFVATPGGGRVVALSEAMVMLGLGKPEGVRLSGVPNDPSRTTYWGKDSEVFMDEVLHWLLAAG